MDLNSIVFTVLFFFLGGLVLVFFVSFLAYKFRNKQTYKLPVQNYQTQEFLHPQPVSVPVQYYQLPIQQYQQQQYQYNINQKPVQSYRPRVSPYQVYTN
jgi:hypothetical protein